MSGAYKRLGVGNHHLGKWSSKHKGDLSSRWKGGSIVTKHAWRKAHPEKERLYRLHKSEETKRKDKERGKKYKLEHRDRYTFLQNKRRMLIKKVGGTFTFQQWIDLCDRCNNTCNLCGKKLKLTIDHIVPVSKGGNNFIENIQPLCLSCNSKKSNKVFGNKTGELKHK